MDCRRLVTYDREIQSPEVERIVEKQESMLREYKVDGTPSVYVLGRYLNPITGNRAFVANEISFTPKFNNRFNLILAKDFVDCCYCQ